MPAPDNATLLDFESAYENATQDYLEAIAGAPFAQVLTPRTRITEEAILETPRAMVRMTGGGLASMQEAIRTTDNERYYCHFTGTLEVLVSSQRNNAAQDHGKLRGWLRVAMLSATATFNANSVPYYQTVQVRESSSDQGIEEANDEINSSLLYLVEWYVKPDQWAAS